MDDAFRNRVREYAAWIAGELRLTDWDIRIIDDEAQEDASADIHCFDGRKVALMRLSSDFDTHTPESRRHTIVHELIHAHIFPLVMTAQDVDRFMPEATFELYCKSITRQMEYAVDGLADAIAPLLPMMEEWEKI